MGRLLLAVFLLAGAERAHANAPFKARTLEAALSDLKEIALDGADDSALAGNGTAAARRDDVAIKASALSIAVHREVLRLLYLGYSHSFVKNRLETMEFDMLTLRNAAYKPGVSAFIRNSYEQAEDAWHELDAALTQLPLSATCSGKFGGNFFNKKTHVECTVNGNGAASYYVVFENEINGSTVTATAQGPLSTAMTQQSFVSDKVSVGNYANYEVYIVDTEANYNLVATGQADGNPF